MSSSKEKQYRSYMNSIKRDIGERDGLTLLDLLISINNENRVNEIISKILTRKEPISIIVEGSSAVKENIDTLLGLVSGRDNSKDKITIFDISRTSLSDHIQHLEEMNFIYDFSIKYGDMFQLPVQGKSVNLVINDFAINYSTSTEENIKVLEEIKRVLKSEESAALLSVVVDIKYDDQKFGLDQENLDESLWSTPGAFNVLPTPGSEKRNAWPVPYYEQMLKSMGFKYTKFDLTEGKRRFPKKFKISYRRYLLEM